MLITGNIRKKNQALYLLIPNYNIIISIRIGLAHLPIIIITLHPPTLSPSFHNNLIKPLFKNIIQPRFQNNISKQTFQPIIQQKNQNNISKTSIKNKFQNSLNNNHNTNHFEDVSQHSNLQKDFQQVTYITKIHHQPNTGKAPLIEFTKTFYITLYEDFF